MSEGLAGFAVKVYSVMLPISWLGLLFVVLVLLPMALFKSTRGKAGVGLFTASWLFGITTWMLGAAVTFATYGIGGFILGLLLFGVGVVPIAIFAAFFKLHATGLGVSLIVMSIIVYVCRAGGTALTEKADDLRTPSY